MEQSICNLRCWGLKSTASDNESGMLLQDFRLLQELIYCFKFLPILFPS